MSITPLPPGWWKTPMHTEEKWWISIAVVWCVLITIAMPAWHFVGKQNSSQEYYTIRVEDFNTLAENFMEQYKIGTETAGDYEWDVVAPPPGSDIFLRSMQWKWDPILKLKKDETYRLHLSSIDVLHGFSVHPLNLNFEAVPGWDYVLTITPTSSGEFRIICNEFCGAEHHGMIGKIIVE
ncbi:MAG: cytochrome C oxidase subunit II [Nitrospinota bacterium]|nr:cytochrome C oxidase subunit II [Nitrospinota bacterium]